MLSIMNKLVCLQLATTKTTALRHSRCLLLGIHSLAWILNFYLGIYFFKPLLADTIWRLIVLNLPTLERWRLLAETVPSILIRLLDKQKQRFLFLCLWFYFLSFLSQLRKIHITFAFYFWLWPLYLFNASSRWQTRKKCHHFKLPDKLVLFCAAQTYLHLCVYIKHTRIKRVKVKSTCVAICIKRNPTLSPNKC